MASPLRLEIKNGWYHVANRGNNRQGTYLKHFLDLLTEIIERHSVEVHAYDWKHSQDCIWDPVWFGVTACCASTDVAGGRVKRFVAGYGI
jgi:hypothetical protein